MGYEEGRREKIDERREDVGGRRETRDENKIRETGDRSWENERQKTRGGRREMWKGVTTVMGSPSLKNDTMTR